jgi:arginine decarboxylase-like protein
MEAADPARAQHARLLQLLHSHIGSQITSIQRVEAALKADPHLRRLRKMGACRVLRRGLGVDTTAAAALPLEHELPQQ